MAPGIWNRFQSFIFGGAIGAAASEAIAPALEPARQRANERNKFRILDPATLAELVSQGALGLDVAVATAARNGYDADKMHAFVHLALEAPPPAEALDLRRRRRITDAQLRHSFAKAQIEEQYWDALAELVDERLSPQEVALGIVRSVVSDPGLLVKTLDTSGSNVPQYKPLSIDPLAEAAASGINEERLRGLVGEIGLPMAAIAAAQAEFRGIITRGAYNQAILEGDTRPEWADAIHDYARQIPSAIDGVQDHLRGWVDADGMYETTARHGMSKKDTDLLFRIHGRPPSWHQIWIGLQRGGSYDGPIDAIDPAFLKGLRESDLRPEWYNLLWHSRYSLPSAFVLRALTQDGTFTEAQTHTILLQEGWVPEYAEQAAKKWAAPQGAAKKEATVADLLALYDGGRAGRAETLAAIEAQGYPPLEAEAKLDTIDARRVASAKTAAIGDLHAKYKKGALPDANALAALHGLGVADWAAPLIVAAWRQYLTAEEEVPPLALPPVVSSFTPAGGPVGTRVALSGSNFVRVSAVHLGALAAVYTVVSESRIDATVPAGALSAQWVVTAAGGSGASGDAFLVA